MSHLRKLVSSAVAGEIKFDEKFANDTIRSVLDAQTRLSLQRNVVGWLSLPLDFIPYVDAAVQKGFEEGVGGYLRKKTERAFPWFYLVSSVSKK